MVRNNNSLDYIIANYAYGFLKKEFVETLPITISAQNLKEEQAVEKARSLVIDTLTNLYYHLEEKYPITRENLEFTPLEPELIIGGKSKVTPDGYDVAVATYKKQLRGDIKLKFYISYEHKNGKARKRPYAQLLTYVLISTYKMRKYFKKNVKPIFIGFLINNGGRVINGFIASKYVSKEKIELFVYWPMRSKCFNYSLDYKILAEGIRNITKENKSLRKGLKNELYYLYDLI